MKRHRHDTDEWMEAVIARYYRRRNLPFRQLETALSDAVRPILDWITRRLA